MNLNSSTRDESAARPHRQTTYRVSAGDPAQTHV